MQKVVTATFSLAAILMMGASLAQQAVPTSNMISFIAGAQTSSMTLMTLKNQQLEDHHQPRVTAEAVPQFKNPGRTNATQSNNVSQKPVVVPLVAKAQTPTMTLMAQYAQPIDETTLQTTNTVPTSTVPVTSNYPSPPIYINNPASQLGNQNVTPQTTSAVLTQPMAPPTPASSSTSGGFNLGQHIHINGFLSAGGAASTTGVGYSIPQRGTVNKEWGFEPGTLFGIQMVADLMDNLSVVAQLVADGETANGNHAYQVNADWAFLRYIVNDAIQVSGGRFRLPAFLYSETQQVGYTYPWVFLPNEVYRILPFQNINGGDAIFSFNFGQTGWTATLEPYVGTNSNQYDLYTQGGVPFIIPGTPGLFPPFPVLLPIPFGTTADLDENSVIGGVLSVGNPNINIRGTYAHMNLSAVVRNFVIPPGTTINLPFFINQAVNFYDIGGKINFHNLLVIGELAHRDTPSQITSLTGYYMLLGYQFRKFLPNFTFARVNTTNGNALATTALFGPAELPQSQQSYTLGLAYYLTSHVVAKASVSFIDPLNGTRGLFNTNPGKDVTLYGISLDAIY